MRTDRLIPTLDSLKALLHDEGAEFDRPAPINRLGEYVADTFATYRITEDLFQGECAFLSRQFCSICAKGHLEYALAALSLHKAPRDMSTRSFSIIERIRSGVRNAVSPFSGNLIPVARSIGKEWYFLEEDGECCFASQMGGIMTAVNLETVWVFLEEKVIIYINNGLSLQDMHNNITAMLQRCLKDTRATADHIFNALPPLLALTDLYCPHMSHNLWNVQTGFANVMRSVPLDVVAYIILFKGPSFFGSFADLHMPINGSPDRYEQKLLGVQDENAMVELMFQKNLFLLSVKDEIFCGELEQRIVKIAFDACDPAFLKDVRDLKARCSPLVLTTVRLDNRAWIEQHDGLPRLFKALQRDFPKLGVIIDGLSSDTVKGWTTSWMSLEDELRLANHWREELYSEMPVMLGVGRKFFEAIVLMSAADLFIAPAGSGMAIYKWILNMPGLSFSNRSVLDQKNSLGWPLRVWHDKRYREDVVPTLHLDPQLVQDGEIAREQRTRANFHLMWEDLYLVSRDYIADLMCIS